SCNSTLYIVFFFFFFFQAEDGIRDKLVTGVQTCALPISAAARPELSLEEQHRFEPAAQPMPAMNEFARTSERAQAQQLFQVKERSEERRVGKECRSRWSRYH